VDIKEEFGMLVEITPLRGDVVGQISNTVDDGHARNSFHHAPAPPLACV
jgi:hypothetical protein